MNAKLKVKTILVNKWRGGSYQANVAHSKLCEGKLFKRKIEPHTMSEKRHKINKFANYQKIIVRNSPAFDCHVFVPPQKPLIFGFYVMSMFIISTQIGWQNPWWSLCKLWERCLDFTKENVWEVAPPSPLHRNVDGCAGRLCRSLIPRAVHALRTRRDYKPRFAGKTEGMSKTLVQILKNDRRFIVALKAFISPISFMFEHDFPNEIRQNAQFTVTGSVQFIFSQHFD